MKIESKITRKADGTFTTQSGAIQTDIDNLTGQKTVASGYTIIGEGKNNNLFIPNDLVDRQGIITETIGIIDALVTIPFGTAGVETVVVNSAIITLLNQVKTNLATIKEELK